MTKCGNEINPGQLNEGHITRDCGRICKDYGAKKPLFTFNNGYCRCSEDADDTTDCTRGGSRKSFRYLGRTMNNIS